MMFDPEKEAIKKLKRKLKQLERQNTEIRDQMTIQRTIFANERTLMAYLRTATALVACGFAAIKISRHAYMELIGLILMPLKLTLAIYSFGRYLFEQRFIKHQLEGYAHTSLRHAKIAEKEPSR
jgi:uncharacterized membrane protein YidH (DUF202 family)